MPNVRQNIRIRQSVFGRIFGFGKNHYSAHPYVEMDWNGLEMDWNGLEMDWNGLEMDWNRLEMNWNGL